ncbi:hypothetical protein NE237_023970 [Protea cynaroides]|uniref:Uncharacterized protein n=1 Tax=Protea cynaroides TaxID=273540 RepID=A0A9Q0HEZ1_9MAGN|nr:hypothetical protein NE237_023970 [Protea cynaroides]
MLSISGEFMSVVEAASSSAFTRPCRGQLLFVARSLIYPPRAVCICYAEVNGSTLVYCSKFNLPSLGRLPQLCRASVFETLSIDYISWQTQASFHPSFFTFCENLLWFLFECSVNFWFIFGCSGNLLYLEVFVTARQSCLNLDQRVDTFVGRASLISKSFYSVFFCIIMSLSEAQLGDSIEVHFNEGSPDVAGMFAFSLSRGEEGIGTSSGGEEGSPEDGAHSLLGSEEGD